MQNKDFKIDIKATKLDLIGQKIGDGRAAALAKALPDAKNLTSLNLAGNNIGEAGAVELAAVLPSTNLTALDLGANKIGDAGAKALADVLPSTNLTALSLGANKIGAAGAAALADVLRDPKNLTSLSLFNNKIGDAGAKALANLLPSTNLTTLDLGWNNIGEAGEAAILRVARENPLFLTRIRGLIYSDAINAAVYVNRQLEMTAKVGVLSLVDNHRFPVPVAVMVAGYVNGKNITEQDIKSIRDDTEVEALLAPAASGSFATLVRVVEAAFGGDDSQNRSDDMSSGLCCVIV